MGTAIAFLVMSWISVALRTYTRAFIMKGFQLDDWFMLIAQVKLTSTPLRLLWLTRSTADIHRVVCFHSRGSQGGTRSTQQSDHGYRPRSPCPDGELPSNRCDTSYRVRSGLHGHSGKPSQRRLMLST